MKLWVVFQGEIFLGHTTSGYLVVPGFGPGFREMGFGFILHTPERAYQVLFILLFLKNKPHGIFSFLLRLNKREQSG